MERLNILDWMALALIIIGALNWGSIGFFNYDVIGAIFGAGSIASRVIFAIVGISGLYTIAFELSKMMASKPMEMKSRM